MVRAVLDRLVQWRGPLFLWNNLGSSSSHILEAFQGCASGVRRMFLANEKVNSSERNAARRAPSLSYMLFGIAPFGLPHLTLAARTALVCKEIIDIIITYFYPKINQTHYVTKHCLTILDWAMLWIIFQKLLHFYQLREVRNAERTVSDLYTPCIGANRYKVRFRSLHPSGPRITT